MFWTYVNVRLRLLQIMDVRVGIAKDRRICEEKIHSHENCARTEGQEPFHASKGAPSLAHSTSKSHPEVNPMRNEELVRRASKDVQESRRAKEVHSAVHLTYKRLSNRKWVPHPLNGCRGRPN